jgi:NADP-reducing hydrogenase subunit HndD
MKVTIDNKIVEVGQGTTIYDAAKQIGIDIPRLCYKIGRAHV